jgi:hypothetical protein
VSEGQSKGPWTILGWLLVVVVSLYLIGTCVLAVNS